ncbi:DUF3492 domain-containing protein [Streptomyces sp. NPDC052052]|uniref:DUF3492 domain-containing protein n=1 Tax=Streptomyces sp. NPDC052052 TaxID=3154756 RepID=UPI00341EEE27
MRIGLLTHGGYPYATGESRLWCDRLVRGLTQHEFDLYALSRSAAQEARGRVQLPPQVARVRTAPLWTADAQAQGPRTSGGLLTRIVTGGNGRAYGRRERQRFTAHLTALATSLCTAGATNGEADAEFTEGLYGLAELAREHGGLPSALRSETAVRLLEAACRAPGTGRSVHIPTLPDLLAFARELDRVLRPLSLDWYDEESLGAVDLCHATSGGAAALPGLLAARFFGVPLLVTEHGAQLRAHHLAATGSPLSAPVRSLLAGLHARLATEVYRQAAVITSGNSLARRWQERCGAAREKLRTIHPGMEPGRFTALGESGDRGPDGTLVWVGRIEPAKDLIALLHAFSYVWKAEPGARLRIVGTPAPGPEGAAYLAHCRALATQLFSDELSCDQLSCDGAVDAHAADDAPVSFDDTGGAAVPDLLEAYAAGGVVVLSSSVEGFPISLVEAMFCGRATVSTDVGAVAEVIGGTGLVVPPRNPRALADACLALLRDPEHRARLGAAARARALELFTVEQNLAAFHGIYRELVPHAAMRRTADTVYGDGPPRPFDTPPEAHVLDLGTAPDPAPANAADRAPRWATEPRAVCAGSRGAGDGDG